MIFLFDLVSGGYSRITTHPESPTTPPYKVRLNPRPHLQDTRNQEVLYPPKQPTQPPKPPPKTFNMPRRVIPTPVLPKVDKDNFYAWKQRRTVKHCIGGVQKIQDYHVDTHRWSTVFSRHLGSAPPLTPGPIEKKKRPSKRWAPYSSPESPALSGARTRQRAKREQLAAVAAANGGPFDEQAARDEAIRAKVFDKTRARFDARRSKCSDCGEPFTDNTGKCGEKCRIAFEAYCTTFEAQSLERFARGTWATAYLCARAAAG